MAYHRFWLFTIYKYTLHTILKTLHNNTVLFKKKHLKYYKLFQNFRSTKCPNEELSLTNCAIVNEADFKDVR